MLHVRERKRGQDLPPGRLLNRKHEGVELFGIKT